MYVRWSAKAASTAEFVNGWTTSPPPRISAADCLPTPPICSASFLRTSRYTTSSRPADIDVVLRRDPRDRRPLEPHLDVVRRRRLRLSHPEQDGALRGDDDARGPALEGRDRLASDRTRDAHAVGAVPLDFGGGRLRERYQRRLFAVLLQAHLAFRQSPAPAAS